MRMMRYNFLSLITLLVVSLSPVVSSYDMELTPEEIDLLKIRCDEMGKDHVFGINVKIETKYFPTGKRRLHYAGVEYIYVSGCFFNPVLHVESVGLYGPKKMFGKRDGTQIVHYISKTEKLLAEFLGEMNNDGRVFGRLKLHTELSEIDRNRANCIKFEQYEGEFGQEGKVEQYLFGATGSGLALIDMGKYKFEATWNSGILESKGLKVGDKDESEYGNFQETKQVLLIGLKSQDKFTGITKNGQLFFGTLISPNGLIFYGFYDVKTNHFIEGIVTYSDGSSYKGGYKKELCHGAGVLTLVNGFRMDGKFKEGLFIKGKVTYTDGVTYDGEYLQKSIISYGFRHGKGKLVQANGLIFEGTFVMNIFKNGKVVYADGCTFEGVMQQVNGNSIRYHGELRYPVAIRPGRFRSYYIGYFNTAGAFEGANVPGNGVLVWSDGSKTYYENGRKRILPVIN